MGVGVGATVGSRLRYLYGIVRMCVPNSPLFQRCKVYGKVPFFNKKVYDLPDIFWFLCKRSHFLTSGICYIFGQRYLKDASQ